jgi:hypothetical protein
VVGKRTLVGCQEFAEKRLFSRLLGQTSVKHRISVRQPSSLSAAPQFTSLPPLPQAQPARRKAMLSTFSTMAATALSIGASAAYAHPVGAAFPTRGACEAALAQINTFDRERLVAIGVHDTPGEANRFFHETFSCQKAGDVWVLLPTPRR